MVPGCFRTQQQYRTRTTTAAAIRRPRRFWPRKPGSQSDASRANLRSDAFPSGTWAGQRSPLRMLNATTSRQSAQRDRCRTTPSRSAPDKACSENAVSKSALDGLLRALRPADGHARFLVRQTCVPSVPAPGAWTFRPGNVFARESCAKRARKSSLQIPNVRFQGLFGLSMVIPRSRRQASIRLLTC